MCKTDAMRFLRRQPWASVPHAALASVVGVLTDIDDTLTTGGAITPDALDALARLKAAGLPVIAVTGRSMGWSRPFALAWPLDAIVAENGAIALFREAGGLTTEYAQDAATRAHNAVRLDEVAQRVLRAVPGSRLARDSPGRVTDIAIDHAEFARLDATQVRDIVGLLREEGLHASVSSIHINGWIGGHNKLSGARWIVQRRLGRDLDQEMGRWIYVGDSSNDQLMFEHFPLGVGVANLMRFAAELRCWPAYLTGAERGAGFTEVADAVLAAQHAARR